MTDSTVKFFAALTSVFWFPEYTDDQRFDDGSGSYGPVAHIVPVDSVKFWTAAEYAAAGEMGKLVGGVAVDDTVDINGTTLAIPYTDLRLSPGNNCLYLANAHGWRAFVTAADTLNPSDPCPPTHSTANPLTVVPIKDATYSTHADVPAVARFHEGTKGTATGRPFMGLKCGDSWCLILPTGVTPTEPFHKPHGQTKQWLVRGWSDLQRLGDAPAGGTAKLTDLEGAIIPDDTLELRQLGDFQNATPVRVAVVHFAKKPDGTSYASKWNFVKDTNEVFIMEDASSSTGWIGIVRNKRPDGSITNWPLVVRRDAHPGQSLPGTARWAWRDKDEWIWVRCGDGCCWISPS